MKKTSLLILLLFLSACASNVARTENQNVPASNSQTGDSVAAGQAKETAGEGTATPTKKADGPKTVRDFFALLPDQYFTLEGCDRATDKNCDKARAEYLKSFLETEDTANGYLKANCDGAQSCLTMALFKRPDGTYLIGLNKSFEMGDDYYFLDYKNGKWTDVSAGVVPEYSNRRMYELPRYGTTVKVFTKKIIEEGPDFMASEKGAKLYDLEWKDGKFVKK
jgi:hypothetical protein